MQTSSPTAIPNSGQRHFPRITFGFSWLIILPAGVWVIFGYYLPLFAGNLDQTTTWVLGASILILAGASIVLHLLAHLGAARLTEKKLPSEMTILIFGDAAQRWPTAGSTGHELLITCAGPFANLLLSGLAYFFWNTQTNNLLNLVALSVCGFNAWLFIINLIPAYPLDGGRLVLGIVRGQVLPDTKATRWGRLFGVNIAAFLTGWSVLLILQNSRFSWETGLITFLLVLLISDGVRLQPFMEKVDLVHSAQNAKYRFVRILGAVLLLLVMLAAPSSLLLLNNGLDAPGVALSVGPMVQIPDHYRHPLAGQFFLVTVISQAPITAGEWLVGQVDPAVQIIPPDVVTPANTTPQQQAKQGFQMLNDSETTAIAVGLRLAGYTTAIVGKGVQVDSILPGSHANGVLQTGDIIIGLNGNPIQTTSDLISGIKAQTSLAPVHLVVKRDQQELSVDVPLMAPATPTDSPKLGVQIEPAGFDYRPPFPVSIQTDKISGGPSAGLMFTLTVYSSLISEDLTRGRRIAGTGTINLDGSVGPIGGVKQKIFAAEAVGATYFLCPVDNYADAVSVATSLKVVKIATVEQAVAFLRSLPAQ